MHKLDFPKYDGKDDPLLYLNRCEQFFRGVRTNEDKVWWAVFHLTDRAQQWYMHLERKEGMSSWTCFIELLNLRFRQPLRDNPLGELAPCRRTRSVTDYYDRFLQTLGPCWSPHGISTGATLYCSVAGAHEY